METQQRKPETPIKDYLATFKFYDNKHRRLSIFGKVHPVSKRLVITVLTLSQTPEIKKTFRKGGNEVKKVEIIYDVFSRKEGRSKYEKECGTPDCDTCPGKVFTIDVIDERPRFTFLQWCNQHYYRPQKISKTVEEIKYVRGTDYVFPEKKKKEEATVSE